MTCSVKDSLGKVLNSQRGFRPEHAIDAFNKFPVAISTEDDSILVQLGKGAVIDHQTSHVTLKGALSESYHIDRNNKDESQAVFKGDFDIMFHDLSGITPKILTINEITKDVDVQDEIAILFKLELIKVLSKLSDKVFIDYEDGSYGDIDIENTLENLEDFYCLVSA